MNKFVKDYLGKGIKLFECIPAIDRVILHLRNITTNDGFNAKYFQAVLTASHDARMKLDQEGRFDLYYTIINRRVNVQMSWYGQTQTSFVCYFEMNDEKKEATPINKGIEHGRFLKP
ncbi:hypothetical protein ACE6H2_015817 [Prunus campanulata]